MPKNSKQKQPKTVNINVNEKKRTKRRRRRLRRNPRRRFYRNRRGRRVGNLMSKTAYRVTRRELWFSGELTQSNNVIHNKKTFDVTDGPVWFKRWSTMFEKFAVRFVAVEVEFGGSNMTKGAYLMTYNTNYGDKDLEPQYDNAAAQNRAKVVRVADGKGRVVIDKRGLTGYKTTLSTKAGEGSYVFDFDLMGSSVPETVDFRVYLDYTVSFYMPQLVN
jgi:hypothetical protein